jgi:hypothetical protein
MCMVENADEMVTMLHDGFVTARKVHKCSECRRVIAKGERYLVERYAFDGTVTTSKTCTHCQVVRQWLQQECGGWLYGGIAEDIHDHAREGYGFGVMKLSIGMSMKWQFRRGGLWPIPSAPRVTGASLPL